MKTTAAQRLFSLGLSVIVTVALLGSIDHLAQVQPSDTGWAAATPVSPVAASAAA